MTTTGERSDRRSVETDPLSVFSDRQFCRSMHALSGGEEGRAEAVWGRGSLR